MEDLPKFTAPGCSYHSGGYFFAPMRVLEKQFRKRGMTYTQVMRGQRVAIYAISDTPDSAPTNWEVFEMRVNRERTIAGVTIPEGEAYPGDEAFGVWAWCYNSLALALRKASQVEGKEMRV